MKLKEIKKDKRKVAISLEGDLTINSVKELKGDLSSYFKSLKNIDIDLSGVKKVDTAGFQLIIMLGKEAAGKDKTLKIINPSNEIKRIFNLYGEVL